MKKSTNASPNKTKPLTIGLVFDDSLDRADGVQQQLKLLGWWLAESGHRVRYLAGETRGNSYAGQPVYSLSRNFKVAANQNRLTLPRPVPASRVAAILDRERFDVLHVMLPYSPFLGRTVVKQALKRQIPLVGTFHTHPASAWQTAGSWAYGRLIKASLRRFKGLTSVSPATKRYVRQTFGVDTLVVPNFIDRRRFSRGRPIAEVAAGQPTVLYLGRLVQRKGPQHLVAAMGRLKAAGRLGDIRLVICGRGPLEDKLNRQIARLGLASQTVMAGHIDERLKPDYLASAELAVFPATGGEAFGIVLIEAMAAGALTLGGDNPGYRTVLGGQPKLLVNPKDSPLLAERIYQLLHDQPERRRLLKWQQGRLARYDVGVVGPDLVRLYRRAKR